MKIKDIQTFFRHPPTEHSELLHLLANHLNADKKIAGMITLQRLSGENNIITEANDNAIYLCHICEVAKQMTNLDLEFLYHCGVRLGYISEHFYIPIGET